MIEFRQSIWNIIKSLIIDFISGLLINYIYNGFDFSKFDLNSFSLIFKEFWFVFVIIFVLSLIYFKVHEKPRFLYIPHSKAEYFDEGYIIHNNIIWKIVVEDINPLYDFENPFTYHYYISKPLCLNCALKENPSLVKLERNDLLFFYLEKCYKCNNKKIRFKSFNKERYGLQILIDGEIEASPKKIYTANDLVNLLKNIQEL